MSVTVKRLNKVSARGKVLDSIVRDHLQIIDDKLLKVDRKWGTNVVSHELPLNLLIPGLDKKSAQLVVYSSIIRSLNKRGFGAKILLEDDKTVLYIDWQTGLSDESLDAMGSLIKHSRIRRSDIHHTNRNK